MALNRAVAVAMRDGMDAGLALLSEVTGLAGYQAFHVARGELLRRFGRKPESQDALCRAAPGRSPSATPSDAQRCPAMPSDATSTEMLQPGHRLGN